MPVQVPYLFVSIINSNFLFTFAYNSTIINKNTLKLIGLLARETECELLFTALVTGRRIIQQGFGGLHPAIQASDVLKTTAALCFGTLSRKRFEPIFN